MEHQQKDIKLEVMEKIKSGGAKMRPKNILMLREIGFIVLLLSLILAGAFIFNLIIAWLKLSGQIDILRLGVPGTRVFFSALPAPWFLFALVFFISSYFVLRHFDFSYKKPFGITLVCLATIMLSVGALFHSLGGNRPLIHRVQQGGMPMMRPILRPDHSIRRDNGVIGVIKQITNNQLIIDADGQEIKVDVNIKTRWFNQDELKIGDIVKVIGKAINGSEYEALGIIKLNNQQLNYLPQFNGKPNQMAPRRY